RRGQILIVALHGCADPAAALEEGGERVRAAIVIDSAKVVRQVERADVLLEVVTELQPLHTAGHLPRILLGGGSGRDDGGAGEEERGPGSEDRGDRGDRHTRPRPDTAAKGLERRL